MNSLPKVVFTEKGFKRADTSGMEQTPAVISWAEAQIMDGDLAEEIAKLKAQPGKPLFAVGGADFMAGLTALGLIDEYHIAIHPVILGGGASIFTKVTAITDLKLVNSKAFPGGVVVHTYHKAGQ